MNLFLKQIYSFICISFITITSCTAPVQESITEKNPVSFTPLNIRLTNQDSDLPEFRKFDEHIERFMKQWDLAGVSLAVMRNDSLLLCKGYGVTNRETQTPTDVRHLFRVASVSKLITAVAIMRLCEEGKLQLTRTVFGSSGILGDSATNMRDRNLEQITVEHLLRHQGGFSRRYGDPLFEPILISSRTGIPTPFTTDDLITFTLQSRLGYRPGAYASYSNLGYAILEKVIEKASGMKYETYVRRNILRAAGCENMFIGKSRPEEAHPDEVHYYEPEDTELVPDPREPRRMVRKCEGGNDISLLGAAGGWIASPVELARLVVSINGNPNGKQIISPRSVLRMTEHQKDAFPLGWMYTSPRGEWRRSGTLSGTSALIRYQQNGYSFVFITNTSTWKGANFTYEISAMMNRALLKVKDWPLRDLFEEPVSESENDI